MVERVMNKEATETEVSRAQSSVVAALIVGSMPRFGSYGDLTSRGEASMYRDDLGGYGDSRAQKVWIWDALDSGFGTVKSRFDLTGQVSVFNAAARFAGLYRETVEGFDGPGMVSEAMKAVSALPREHGALAGRLIDGMTANAIERLRGAESKDFDGMWNQIDSSKRATRLEIAGLSHLVHNIGPERLSAMTDDQIRAELTGAAKAVEQSRIELLDAAVRQPGTIES